MKKINKFYRFGGIFQRILVSLRPLICPFDNILEHLPKNKSVLDVGCGVGALLITMSNEGLIKSGLGVDINQNSIRIAKSAASLLNESNLKFETISMPNQMPIGPFDVITMIDVMHHVPKDKQIAFFLDIISRLAIGGTLIYKDMAIKPWWKSQFNKLHDLIFARQLINYVPLQDILDVATKSDLVVSCIQKYSLFAYAHELVVFKKNE